MKERPIILSAPMVRALLEGRKTQTRRALRPQPVDPYTGRDLPAGARPDALPACPYGAPGDRLWVRETWGLRRQYDITDWYRGPIGGASMQEWAVDFRADFGAHQEACFWRPSIHMPRWAARLVLEVTSARVGQALDLAGNPWVWVLGLRRVQP